MVAITANEFLPATDRRAPYSGARKIRIFLPWLMAEMSRKCSSIQLNLCRDTKTVLLLCLAKMTSSVLNALLAEGPANVLTAPRLPFNQGWCPSITPGLPCNHYTVLDPRCQASRLSWCARLFYIPLFSKFLVKFGDISWYSLNKIKSPDHLRFSRNSMIVGTPTRQLHSISQLYKSVNFKNYEGLLSAHVQCEISYKKTKIWNCTVGLFSLPFDWLVN